MCVCGVCIGVVSLAFKAGPIVCYIYGSIYFIMIHVANTLK